MILTPNILEQDLGILFGLPGMNERERADLLDNIGGVILESAALRFMVESGEDAIKKFEAIIDAHAESDDMLPALLKEFPRFGELLEEEIVAFKEEANAVLI